MIAKAYVLVEAEAGKLKAVVDALKALPSIHLADVVTGPYDVIATIETADQRAVGRIVMDVFHTIDGIRRTTTCLVIG